MGSDAPTIEIGMRGSRSLYYAGEQAERIGLPFTQHVTINYSLTKIDPRAAVPSFSRLRRNYLNKWLTRPRMGCGPAVPPTYAYAFENERNGQVFMSLQPGEDHNVHVHLHIHVPAARLYELERVVWDAVEVTTGGITGGAETIDIRPMQSREIMRAYLLKGGKKQASLIYRKGRKEEPQGLIIGRRSDTSRNVGPTARREWDRKLGVRRRLPIRPIPGLHPTL